MRVDLEEAKELSQAVFEREKREREQKEKERQAKKLKREAKPSPPPSATTGMQTIESASNNPPLNDPLLNDAASIAEKGWHAPPFPLDGTLVRCIYLMRFT